MITHFANKFFFFIIFIARNHKWNEFSGGFVFDEFVTTPVCFHENESCCERKKKYSFLKNTYTSTYTMLFRCLYNVDSSEDEGIRKLSNG